MSVRIEWVCPECGANGETISEGKVDGHRLCTRCGAPVVERVFETGDFKKFASEFRVLPGSDTARIPVKCPKCGKRCTSQRMDLLSGKLHCPCGQVLGPMDFDPEAGESKPDAAHEAPKPATESDPPLYKDSDAAFDRALNVFDRMWRKAHGPSIFSEAEQTINGPRAEDYGDANESFARIAALWSAYLNTPVSSADVAMMMSLLKMVRLKYSKFAHHDSFVDLLGYVGLAHKVSGEK